MEIRKRQKFICAFILFCYLPIVAWELAKKNKNKILAIVIIFFSIFFLLLFLYGGGNDIIINDVSAAFTTNKIRPTTEAVVIHHTAGTLHDNINGIAKIHFGEHKWSTIGYHFFIDGNGVIYKLKPDNEIAPHSYHYNENSVAICLAGNFNEYEPTRAQWEAVKKLTRQILTKYNLTPFDVYKHGELDGNKTECCGNMFDIKKLREEL